ncbi:MAG TPA: S46 family peptidase [Flavipsychrobacter sp.]|nr:S46 family peptidase [Flavipsychrobacter sp.]
MMYHNHRARYSVLKAALTLLTVGVICSATAKEGMWLPPTIKDKAEDMKAAGLRIPVEKIYNSDGTGLNNAVVLFGKGCTGEIISGKGLLLTNHHCGYGTVQGLSSSQSDYFANGFFAKSMSDEIPCPGLTVTFIRRMENVSDKILSGIKDDITEGKRDSIISVRVKNLEKAYKHSTGLDASIQPFYSGNQYWVSLMETFRDIRLVGFPPNGIGQFGGDTDNWMWPRHTGDFSMFRIYAGAGNKPAEYSKSNKPYQAKQFFTINAGGYKEGDFTMVYGFPGYTQQYISGAQVNQIENVLHPVRIAVRTKKLEVLDRNMNQSRDVFLKYTSKRAGIANGWKKWQGEIKGVKDNNVLGIKRNYESEFQRWAAKNPGMAGGSDLLTELQIAVNSANELAKADEYIKEAVFGIELIQQGAALDKMLKVFKVAKSNQQLRDSLTKIVNQMNGFYKNYDVHTDKELFTALMPLYFNNVSVYIPSYYHDMKRQYGNYAQWAESTYGQSLLADQEKLRTFATRAELKDIGRILSDPAYQLYSYMVQYRTTEISPSLVKYSDNVKRMNRLYLKNMMLKEGESSFYPDANLTLRVTYGKVHGLDPDGPAGYSYQTNLDEVIAKDKPNVAEFAVPAYLKTLHSKKDYGRWAAKGVMPVAFIADNHTSGGNSGSPVLNAKGELIGTNFDRVWEGTMSDIDFNSKVCRNISLDVRYTLFVVEKFGNAKWLLNEMRIVNN